MGRRFFRHGELPLVLLALLDERPRHGYDLMAELGRLFAPVYSPSPGSVYPAIEALEAEGLISPRSGDGPRVYGLMPAGREALEKRRDVLAEIELRTGMRLGQRGAVDALLDRFVSQVRPLAGRVDQSTLERALDRALDDIERSAEDQTAASGKGRT